MTWYISFLKTRVLLSVVWQTIFSFLINCRNVSIWECPAFLPLVVWLHSLCSFPLLMSSCGLRRAGLTFRVGPSHFPTRCFERLGPQVLRLGCSAPAPDSDTHWSPRTHAGKGAISSTSRAMTKGASQWRSSSAAQLIPEQKHAGVSAWGSVPPSFHTAWVVGRRPHFPDYGSEFLFSPNRLSIRYKFW